MAIDIDVARRLGDRTIAARFTAGAGLTALFGPVGRGQDEHSQHGRRPDQARPRPYPHRRTDAVRRGTDLPPEARRVGYVFQDGRLFPHRRVRANLLYGAISPIPPTAG
jgi:molybdate transport system ATP-binding protein